MRVQRADRVGDQIKRELGELIRAELKDPRIPTCTGVSQVEVTRDLSHATAYISVLGTDKEQKECIEALSRAAGFLRREISSRVRVHHSPELHFKLDDSVRVGIRMSKLIDEALASDAQLRAQSNPNQIADEAVVEQGSLAEGNLSESSTGSTSAEVCQ